MAYTMMHIVIAERVFEQITGVKDHSTYLLGTIAPDAVHARDNYEVTQKEKSHLFVEGLRWGKIENHSLAEDWENSIGNYYLANQEVYYHDFLLGYIVHLFADVYNSIHFYAPFMRSAAAALEKEREHFKKENFGYNSYLFKEYSKNHNLKAMLESARPITLDGVITKEDVEKRIKQLFEFELTGRESAEIENYTICSHEVMNRLIEETSDYVAEKIKGLD